MGREACFSFLRKYSLCWALFMFPEVFSFQLRSCEKCTPRNLMFSTLSTVRLLMLRGVCSGCDLQKSIIIMSALSTRLFSLHQPSRCLTSSLYIVSSFIWMSPTTVVSSAKWWSGSPCVWMHSQVLETMDWVHSLEEIQCSAWWSWKC